MSEPAILVKRKGRGSQIWAMEKFENKIIDMRDLYEERKEKGLPMKVDSEGEEEYPRYLTSDMVCPAWLIFVHFLAPAKPRSSYTDIAQQSNQMGNWF